MGDILLGTGRRKTSVARVMLSEGSGEYSFNGKNIEEYFPSPSMRMKINKPFLRKKNLKIFLAYYLGTTRLIDNI